MAEDAAGALELARHYVDIDRPSKALSALEHVSGEDLEDPQYWLVRAEALLGLERHADGVEAALRGLELDPDDIGLLDALAIGRAALGQLGEAERALATALELAPEHPLLLGHRGLVLAEAKRVAEAREAITQAMRVAPDWTPVLRLRAQVAVLTEDPAAAGYIDELLARDPEDQIGHALRGNLAAGSGRVVAASRAFDEAARLSPSDPELTRVARDARVAAHPVLAPLRPLWRFGRWESYFVYLTIFFALGALRLESLRLAIGGVWISLVILSWTAPRIIRWRHRRKYGDF
jgi:Flp pilus assembly protein TadD